MKQNSTVLAVKNKIHKLDSLLKQVENWKKENHKIVFTNGCFDILHFGHVDYLNRARDLGDHLIIGVNSDFSTQRLKGKTRPIQDENSRLMVLASMQCVSAVVLFDEDTPLNLIEQILPNVLVKGSDYKIEEIVGAKAVLENNGAVKTIDFISGYSTSNIEKRILLAHKE